MPIQLSMKDVLSVVEQFNSNELEVFIQKVQTLRTKKATIKIEPKIEELIKIIHRNFTEEEQVRFNELIKKRQTYEISEIELNELIEMSDYVEMLAVERVNALAKLSKLTGKSVDTLMIELDVKPRQNG